MTVVEREYIAIGPDGDAWTVDSVADAPDGYRAEEYVRATDYASAVAQRDAAEKLLSEIKTGKHSLPGTLVQIERYFERRFADDE